VKAPQLDRLLVLSMGDPAGIGPEILLKAALGHLRCRRDVGLVAVAPMLLLRHVADRLGLDIPLHEALAEDARPGCLTVLPWSSQLPARPTADTPRDEIPAAQHLMGLPAHPTRPGGLAAWASLAQAVDLVLEDPRRRALVTAPLAKAAVALAGFAWPGHTEYLGWRCAVADPLMWMDAPHISVGLVSNHDALFDLKQALAPDRVEHKIRLAMAHMRLHHPGDELCVLALNPHAGDGGHLGVQELEWQEPLLESLRTEGLALRGPLPADAALATGRGRHLAMYHDQGLPAFKLAAGMEGVNVTLGLPIVRCSPDHGTAFDLAGRGVADARSMDAALRRAVELLETRP